MNSTEGKHIKGNLKDMPRDQEHCAHKAMNVAADVPNMMKLIMHMV